ncbi:MAG: hypothetical protein QXW20_07575 [Ignisphaera sp.]
MSTVERIGSEILTIVIAIVIVGIVLATTTVVLTQFRGLGINIPNEFTPENYHSLLALVIMIVVISVIVGVVFEHIIPNLKKATGAGADTATPPA